jgi:hypothetical protein
MDVLVSISVRNLGKLALNDRKKNRVRKREVFIGPYPGGPMQS